MVPLLEQHPNLVVLRTFSKAMALAGLRVGYLLASPELVREVNKARLPYNVNFLSQMAALAALEEPELLADGVQLLVEERERDCWRALRTCPACGPCLRKPTSSCSSCSRRARRPSSRRSSAAACWCAT